MFILALLLYPVVEITAFVLVVRATSLTFALLLTLATSILGLILFRLQRRGPLFGASKLNDDSLKNYLFGNLGALGLILPGFVSDVAGLLVAIPFTRKALVRLLQLLGVEPGRNSQTGISFFAWGVDSDRRQSPFQNSESTDPDYSGLLEEDDGQDWIDAEYVVKD